SANPAGLSGSAISPTGHGSLCVHGLFFSGAARLRMVCMKTAAATATARPQRVLIATTAMLAFISFWRAAAVVLNHMGSSAFYAGAIAEHFVGKTAPWFILAIMVIAYAVRSMYIESCSMFVRGGVYRVVKEAMGSTIAKFSVSALMFDYVLTG